ncbi:hypothetical protein [Lutibacter citreus]|uniref:hypothetical protein n=1 Tax=Lutibacter citreus TaxID=2138210 RepID=UPI000DBE08B0|nr:hypothetical protein [Lutibacter citreus]
MKNIKFLLLLVTFTTFLSCNSDDDMDLSDKLIGEWLRTDFSENLEFKLNFLPDNTGYKTFKEGNMGTTIVSSAIMFNWSTDENILTFDELDEINKTSFSFNKTGQLILIDYSDLPFNKVE